MKVICFLPLCVVSGKFLVFHTKVKAGCFLLLGFVQSQVFQFSELKSQISLLPASAAVTAAATRVARTVKIQMKYFGDKQ